MKTSGTNIKGIFMTLMLMIFSASLSAQTYSKAAWFNSSIGSYIESPGFAHPGGQQLTVSAWVMSDSIVGVSTNPHATIITLSNKFYDSNLGVFWLQLDSTGNYFEFVVQTTNQKKKIKSITQIENKKWYFLAGVYTGEDIRFFVDGELEAVCPLEGYLNLSQDPYTLQFGRWGHPSDNYRLFSGAIDDVSIWSRALEEWEIYQLIVYPYSILSGDNSPFGADNLLGFWNFDSQNESNYNLTGLSGPEVFGSCVTLSYDVPMYESIFQVNEDGENPFSGKIRSGQVIIQLNNGNATIHLPIGNHLIEILDLNDHIVKSETISICCSGNSFHFIINEPPTVFYSTGATDAFLPSSWNSKRDGSGVSPENIHNAPLKLIVQSGHTITPSNLMSFEGSLTIEENAVFSTACFNHLINNVNLLNGGSFIVDEHCSSLSGIQSLRTEYNSHLTFHAIPNDIQHITPTGILTIDLKNETDTFRMNRDLTLNSLYLVKGYFNIAGNNLTIQNKIHFNKKENNRYLLTPDHSHLIISGSSSIPIELFDIKIEKLTVCREGGITLKGNMYADTIVLLNGKINVCQNNRITIPIGGEIIGGNNFSYINGKLTRQSNTTDANVMPVLFFPIGDNNKYRPVVFQAIQKESAISNFSLEYFSGLHPNTSMLPDDIEYLNQQRYLSFSCENKTKISHASIKISYGIDDNIINPEDITLARFDGQKWINIGGEATDGHVGYIETLLHEIPEGDIVIANSFPKNDPLPVELISFKAFHEDGSNLITWSTASETNNKGFTIEKCVDNLCYSPVAFIQGAGTTSGQNDYSYWDKSIDGKVNGLYYRLIQTDWDGTQTIYPPVFVSTENQNKFNLEKVFFNASNELEIWMKIHKGQAAQIQVLSIEGRTLSLDEQYLNQGLTILKYPGNNLPIIVIINFIIDGKSIKSIKVAR